MPRKIQSVLELARYKVGDTAWWVILRPLEPSPIIAEEDEWMEEHHPKILYTRGPYKKMWPYHAKLPRLHHIDFEYVVNLLRSRFEIETFDICEIIRSSDTGEFFYCNSEDEWMPESHLFDSSAAARRERSRIKRLLKRWVK